MGGVAGIGTRWVKISWTIVFSAIVALSLLPGGSRGSSIGSSWVWNLGHAPAYALLTFVTLIAVAGRMPVTPRTRWLVAAAVILFAVALELVQPLVLRTASAGDVAYTGMGVAMGVWSQHWVSRKDDAGRQGNGRR